MTKTKIFKQEKETRKKFNLLKKYYDKTWDLRDHTLHVGLFNEDIETLEEAYDNATEYLIKKVNKVSQIGEDSVVLDVGCGTGRTLIMLCEKYSCSGVGVDISDEMIEDAKEYLQRKNKKRDKIKLLHIDIKFIRGSGSKLDEVLKQNEQFTHIISQDALFLVVDNHSLYKNLYRLLKKGGILWIDDFLGESKKEELGIKQKELIYKMVNWSESPSFHNYEKILNSVGFSIVSAEKKDKDMIKTYNLLTKRMEKYSKSKDQTFKSLQERYKSIVDTVKNKKMGWGIFVAKK